MEMMLVLGIVFFIICLVGCGIAYKAGSNKSYEVTKALDDKIKQQNNELLKEVRQKEEQLQKLDKEYKEKVEYVSQFKSEAESQYREWIAKYKEDFDRYKYSKSVEKEVIDREVDTLNKDLESLKSQKQSTIEALRREQEVEENPAKYNLPLQDDEIHDIEYLNQIRPKMRFPQVIGKVIWSSFVQKKMNNFLTNILGTEKVCGIYKITDQLTKEAYIGQSVDVHTRFTDHIKCGVGALPVSSSHLLYAAMRRDGIENFSFELLESCEKEKLNEKERYYISLYQTDTCGLNITKGNS